MNFHHKPHEVPEALRRLYQRDARDEPGPDIDRAVLGYARSSTGRNWREMPQVVWPLAVAASSLLAVGLAAWLGARLPAPGYGQVALPAPVRLPEYPALPDAAIGEDPGAAAPASQGVLEHSGLPAAIAAVEWSEAAETRQRLRQEGQQQALDQLQWLADRGRIADHDLLMTYFALRSQWPDLQVPPTLMRAVNEALARAQARRHLDDAR